MFTNTSTRANDGVRRAWIGVGAPIFGLVLVTIVLALAVFAGFAREQDRAFEETSRRLVTSAIDGRARSVGNVTLDYANWDEAFQSVTVRWDQSWVDNNLYSTVLDGMLIVRADGSVRYAWLNEAHAGRASALTAAVARAAVETPRLRQLSRASNTRDTVARTLTTVGGDLVLVSVAPVTPEDDAARIARRASDNYFVFFNVLTSAELAEMGASLDLQGLSFATTVADSRDRVSLTLQSPTGRSAGAAEWRHSRPGQAAFGRNVGPAILALLIIGALAAVTARVLVGRQVGVMAHAHAATESSRLKSEFLTRVSHELRTPINAIVGYAEIIQEDNENTRTAEDGARIIEAARHLSHLLNDIFDQARLDAGGMRFNPEVLPVAGVLAEIQGLMRPAAAANKVRLTVSSEAQANYIVADHLRVRQCLLNLTGNAIKFSPNGDVSVKARAEIVNGRPMVVFDVADTGIGIGKAELDALFRPFGQANESINRDFGGTGLGLSISRDLARAMQGDITVVSELGEGSTFSLVVPAVTAAAVKAA